MPPAQISKSPNVLSVSPLPEDHLFLDGILGPAACKLFMADHLPAALAILPSQQISVVVCERDLLPGAWTDLLDRLHGLPYPPLLIVTSGLADDQLWAEALNLGAWDVLAKPFERGEVLRTINAACRRWHERLQLAGAAVKIVNAAN